MSKLPPAQQKVIDYIAANGYIPERDVRPQTKGALWDAGLIDFETISVLARIDPNRMTLGRVGIDAFVLTEKGKMHVT